ncbi:MAG: zinc-binding dehydrogenase [Actinomycetota bacterium]|nr:zinc-binding dehydrogenase [Actinomycetota bacterium]
MKALLFSADATAEVVDREPPRPGPGEVLVAARAVGICHSDYELLESRYILPVTYPVVPGHEWSGEVAEVGPDVEGFAPGDRVVGECVVGDHGEDHFGFTISGAAAEWFLAKAEWLHQIPDRLTWSEAALVEPFTVGYNACRLARVSGGDKVAVLGGGPIGLLSAIAALGAGGHVTLLEPREDRRVAASALGVHETLDPTSGDLDERVAELTDGRLFDVVVESAGIPAAMSQALDLAGLRARLSFVGISRSGRADAAIGSIQAKELEIRGVIGSIGVWEQAIEALAIGGRDLSPIVTGRFPLARALDALEAARVGSGNIKVQLEVGA